MNNRVKIRLETSEQVVKFINQIHTTDAQVHLTNGDNFRVSGRSLLGAMCTIEWDDVYCESDKPIDHILMDYIVLD